MIAVIKTSGKQYYIRPGDVIKVDRISGRVGDHISFDKVIAFHDGDKSQFGDPFIESSKVGAKILQQSRDKKVLVFKKKRRKNYRRKKGHRQNTTVLQILQIKGN